MDQRTKIQQEWGAAFQPITCMEMAHLGDSYTALLWQKEASDKSDIFFCTRAKWVCHFN